MAAWATAVAVSQLGGSPEPRLGRATIGPDCAGHCRATVPECTTATPVLVPGFTPDKHEVGGSPNAPPAGEDDASGRWSVDRQRTTAGSRRGRRSRSAPIRSAADPARPARLRSSVGAGRDFVASSTAPRPGRSVRREDAVVVGHQYAHAGIVARSRRAHGGSRPVRAPCERSVADPRRVRPHRLFALCPPRDCSALGPGRRHLPHGRPVRLALLHRLAGSARLKVVWYLLLTMAPFGSGGAGLGLGA